MNLIVEPAPHRSPRLAVKRSTSFGQDRLYVTMPDGEIVGWTDLRSGEVKLQRPELSAAFDGALAEWRRLNELAGDG
jgi:hypothetical protein